MDKIKSAVGVGNKDQEGQEPVSGESGEGTTAKPFDAGNKPGTYCTSLCFLHLFPLDQDNLSVRDIVHTAINTFHRSYRGC